MSIKAQLSEIIKTSMKSGDKGTLTYGRSLHAAIRKREIDDRKDLDDAEIQKIITTVLKQRRESIEQFTKGARMDLVANEEAEVKFLSQFMPEQMSMDELAKIIDGVLAEVKPTSAKDMGKVMQALMPKVQGRADGKTINQLVREKLGPA